MGHKISLPRPGSTLHSQKQKGGLRHDHHQRIHRGSAAESVLENAKIEDADNRVEMKEGDARELPLADGAFDIVVHEMKDRSDRERMLHEIARVLKPGGRVVLVDFSFMNKCVADLWKSGVETERTRDGFVSFWVSVILNFGAVETHHVVGRKSWRPCVRTQHHPTGK
jgi:SAM-dependent methyltransferase